MTALPAGQFYPSDSPVHRLDARAKLLCLLLLVAASVAVRAVLGYAVLAAATLYAIWLARLPLAATLGAIGRLWKFFLVIFVMNALFFDAAHPILQWWIFRLSAGGVLQGVRVVACVALVMAQSAILTATTRPVAITDALACLLKPLSLLGVPVADVAMIISVAIRFVPTLMEETELIKKAQTARGARFDSRRLTQKAAALIPLVVPIFLSAFRRADELSMAMESRGYRGARGRTHKRVKRLARVDWVWLLLCTLLSTSAWILFR